MNRWSVRLGRLAGIDFYLHWTFILLIVGLAFLQYSGGAPLESIVASVGLMLAMFGCVALHEFGHALAAAQFGVKTKDITLLPIGGVARLERMPEKPWQELIVAVAGPAVNVAIAAGLFAVLAVGGNLGQLRGDLAVAQAADGDFLVKLLMVNVGLVLFNMLPSFPMDGGRVLRSVLAMFMPHVTATTIAARVGQVMAGLFAIGGLLTASPMLILVALFVFFAAQAELAHSKQQAMIGDAVAGSAMSQRFLVVSRNDAAGRIAEAMWTGSQPDFPVLDEGRVVGMLSRQDVWQALQSGKPHLTAGELMRREVVSIAETAPIAKVMELLQSSGASTIVVLRGAEMAGLITPAGLHQWAAGRKAAMQQPIQPVYGHGWRPQYGAHGYSPR
jgi:Zn-dependent protease/predicted transcriptional regulator